MTTASAPPPPTILMYLLEQIYVQVLYFKENQVTLQIVIIIYFLRFFTGDWRILRPDRNICVGPASSYRRKQVSPLCQFLFSSRGKSSFACASAYFCQQVILRVSVTFIILQYCSVLLQLPHTALTVQYFIGFAVNSNVIVFQKILRNAASENKMKIFVARKVCWNYDTELCLYDFSPKTSASQTTFNWKNLLYAFS